MIQEFVNMKIDASGFIPSEISCQNPTQCYILMYMTTARPSSLSLISLRSFFLMIFPNLDNCNHIPASGKTLRCKLTLRYESMLFAHSRRNGSCLSAPPISKLLKKKSIWRNRTYKRKTGLMKHSPQTDREESGTPTLLTTRKERRRKKRKGSEEKKQTEVRGRIQRMGRREE